MALTTTVGGSNTDSYVTLAEANTIASELSALVAYGLDITGWSGATDQVKEAALRVGATQIDSAQHVGYKASATQALAYPRVGCTNNNYDNTVPKAIKEAQVAQAMHMLTPQSSAKAAADAGIQAESFGTGRSVTYRQNSSGSMAVNPCAYRLMMLAGLIGSSVYMPRR